MCDTLSPYRVLSDVPSTSYVKALDVWIITCFCYTFVNLFEYCVVLYLARESGNWYDKLRETRKGNGKGKRKKENNNPKASLPEINGVNEDRSFWPFC